MDQNMTNKEEAELKQVTDFFDKKIFKKGDAAQLGYFTDIVKMLIQKTTIQPYTRQNYGKKYTVIYSEGVTVMNGYSFKNIKTNVGTWATNFKSLYANNEFDNAMFKFFSILGSLGKKNSNNLKATKAEIDTLIGNYEAMLETSAELFDMVEAPTISTDTDNIPKLVEGMSEDEKVTLGNIIASKSLKMKTHKGRYIEAMCSARKNVKIYIPDDNEQIDQQKPTINKYIIGVGDATAASMYKKDQMSALGQAIGLNAFNDVNSMRYISKIAGSSTVVRQHIFTLISLPKMKPHSFLKLTTEECLIWIAVSVYNDALNDLSTKVKEPSTFAKDTYSKLVSGKIIAEENIPLEKLEKYIKVITAVCTIAVNKKTQIPRSVQEMMVRAKSMITTIRSNAASDEKSKELIEEIIGPMESA